MGLYAFEKKNMAMYFNLLIAFAIVVSFSTMYTMNQHKLEIYKTKKVEMLIIPSEFTPLKRKAIYDIADIDVKTSIVFFTNDDKRRQKRQKNF